MKLTKRETWALKALLRDDIISYLLACTHGRQNGSLQAEYHISMSRTLCMFMFAGDYQEYDCDKSGELFWVKVHDYLSEILTGRMDEVIGFPLDKPTHGQTDYFADEFFKVIVANIDGIHNCVKGGKF